VPFVEQEESIDHKIVDGKKVIVYKPRVEVTIKHIGTGREYMSDMEAQADVDSAVTDTKKEHISRSVHIKVQSIPLGTTTNSG
jgi:hypothetical protein